jgi:hypothetical protein
MGYTHVALSELKTELKTALKVREFCPNYLLDLINEICYRKNILAA